MAYSKQTWDTTSYVNPTRMNHIEDGIDGIPEIISNANGIAYKFNNGLLICTKTISGSLSSGDWTAWGSLYTTQINCGNFAEEFISVPSLSITSVLDDYTFMVGGIVGLTKSGVSKITLVRATTTGAYSLSIIAIGRWK